MAATHGDFLVILCLLIIGHSSAKLKGKFVQINDIHYDPTYLRGTGDSCNKQTAGSDRKPYGNYDCGASWNLTESALYKVDMESSSSTTDFIIWAGDSVMSVRERDMLDAETTLTIIKQTANMLKDRLRSDVPIYPMLGNHDFFPKDQLPEHDPNVKNDFYSRIADILCPLFIEEDSCVLFRKNGYYSVVLEGQLRVIIMNTNLYSAYNDAVAGPDPAGQFDWLRRELQQTQALQQKAHVFGHIPPGMLEVERQLPMMKAVYNTNFNKIIRDFANVILGVYSGHTHTDSFRVVYSKDSPKRPLVSVLINPSVTPQRLVWTKTLGLARNPALRSVYYDVTTPDFFLKDYTQFYLSLDKANSGDSSRWMEEYRFTRSYPVADLTARSLHEVVEDFKKAGSDYFHLYFDHNSVSIHENVDKPAGKYYCDCRCKQHHICTIQNIDTDDYAACLRDNIENMTCAAANFRSLLFLPLVALVALL